MCAYVFAPEICFCYRQNPIVLRQEFSSSKDLSVPCPTRGSSTSRPSMLWCLLFWRRGVRLFLWQRKKTQTPRMTAGWLGKYALLAAARPKNWLCYHRRRLTTSRLHCEAWNKEYDCQKQHLTSWLACVFHVPGTTEVHPESKPTVHTREKWQFFFPHRRPDIFIRTCFYSRSECKKDFFCQIKI